MDDVARVECYSGHQYAERPVAFYWQGQRLEVQSVQATWRIPEGRRFRVRTVGDQVFELVYLEDSGQWQVQPV